MGLTERQSTGPGEYTNVVDGPDDVNDADESALLHLEEGISL